VSLAANQHIRMISEGSYDMKDDVENSAKIHILEYTQIKKLLLQLL